MSDLTCREIVDFLMSYLDGELVEAERVAFENHLSICPMCVDFVRNYEQTVRLSRDLAETDGDAQAVAGMPDELVKAILAAARNRDPG